MTTLLGLMLAIASNIGAVVDFSGQWTADPPAVKSPGDMGSGWSASIAITQDERQLVVEEMLFSRYDLQPPVRTVYALDGSESRNAVMTGHATQVRMSRAKWDGDALVITTTYPAVDPGTGKSFTSEISQRLTLDAPGVLVIAVTRSAALGGKPTAAKMIYRKK